MSRILIKGNRVTPEEVENAIIKESYTKLGAKIVVCHLTLADNFEVIGKAGVVDSNAFDMAIGAKFSRMDALNRVWEHMGSILQDRLLEQAQHKYESKD